MQASLIPAQDLKTVVSDLDRAIDLGLESGLVLEQLAGSEFSLALHDQPWIRMECDRPVPFQMDGEYVGPRTELLIEAGPEALSILC